MSDIDFDEIDKAVNSAIQQQPGDSSAAVDDNAQDSPVPSERSARSSFSLHGRTMASHRVRSEDKNDTQDEVADNEVDSAVESLPSDSIVASGQTPVQQVSEPTDNSTDARQSLPKRRAGRFMDVVHPSSDMRSKSMTQNPPRREGVSLEPVVKPQDGVAIDPAFNDIISSIDADATSESEQSSSPTPALSPETSAPELVSNNAGDSVPVDPSLEAAINDLLVSEGHEPVSATSSKDTSTQQSSESSTKPSPIDVSELPDSDQAAVVTDESTAKPVATDETSENPDELSMDDVLTEDKPQTSPFIEGAKIEKRPLGGALTSDTSAESDSELEPDVEDLSSKGRDVTKSEPLPEELSQDLTTIDSIEASLQTNNALPTEAPAESKVDANATDSAAASPVDEKAPTEKAEKDSTDIQQAAKPEEKPYTGPTSIAQQYKLDPTGDKDDDETGDIFDTKTYHQPIKSDDKKSSPLPWVIGAVILFLLIAVGVYFAWWSGMIVVPM